MQAAILPTATAPAFDSVTHDGRTFVNKGLMGVGRIPADLRDKFGETFGSGSGLADTRRTFAFVHCTHSVVSTFRLKLPAASDPRPGARRRGAELHGGAIEQS
jgi:hypothetical protein